MAVNGIEIKVGQVWRTRARGEVEIEGHVEGSPFQWRLSNGNTVTDEGQMWTLAASGDDIVELVRDENGFTIWRGGEQPAETKGKWVMYRVRNGDAYPMDADRLDWTHRSSELDIEAYKFAEGTPAAQPAPDSDALACETLYALGYRWDGQSWVQDHQPVAPGALGVQVGGVHYKSLAIQPIQYIHANGIPFAEGSVIKYVTRWRAKNGIADLKKARHFLDLLIELEEKSEGGAA